MIAIQPYLGSYETRRWTPRRGLHAGRKHRRVFSFQAYVPKSIAEWDPMVQASDAAIIAQADRAVSDLNRVQDSLALEALARQLLRQESVSSSRLEGLVMGQKRLARADFDLGRDEGARVVMNNIQAMERSIALGAKRGPFRKADLLEIHRTLMSETALDHIGGIIRTEQNWLGGSHFSPAGAAYIPPPPEYVDDLLDDLVEFINKDDLPITLQAAAAHAQFETIHPFMDGNGRVGRCLIHIVFERRRIANRIVPPVSLVLATHSDDYIKGLTAWRGSDPLEWCVSFGAVTITAVEKAYLLAEQINQLIETFEARAGKPRQGSSTQRLIAALPGRPIVNVADAQEITETSWTAADRAIRRLEEAGILKPIASRERDRVWEATDVFKLLDKFQRQLATPPGSSRPVRPVPRLAQS